MEEIKFQVWDKNQKAMCNEPGYIQIDGHGNFAVFDDNNGWQENGKNHADLTLIQYIGLTDINNTDVYDGWILEYVGDNQSYNEQTPERAVVVWLYDRWTLKSVYEKEYYLDEELENVKDYKIIGNKYENEDLLPKNRGK